MHPKGPVWNHFKESSGSAVCNHYNKNYNKATAKSSTNPLWYHLKVKHNIHPDKSAARSSATGPKKPATSRLITSFVQRKSQQKMYAELTATDRLSFNQITRSDFIRSAMRDKKFIAHSSPTTIHSKVFEFYQEAKAAVTDELKQGISKGLRFAVSFDEWTGKNRRCLTLNVHTKDADFYNLGMVRVWASQTAEMILKLVTLRLQEFGVELHHITAFVTDGASIMMKLGRITPCEHIVCLSHTLHLVITDVFYKKMKTADDSDSEETEDQEQQDDDDEEKVDDNDASVPSLEEPLGLGEALPELAGDIEPVIKKVRKIVSKFRRSPVKNDLLQKEVALTFDKELTLLRDCKTRWSSMHTMLKRFLKTNGPVNTVLEELELGDLRLTDGELQLVKTIDDSLEPFQVA